MANGWTDKRRTRQSDLIHTWKPWEKSTGPKSSSGKAVSSQNAYRGAWRIRVRLAYWLARERWSGTLKLLDELEAELKRRSFGLRGMP